MDSYDAQQLELDQEECSSFPDFQHLNIDLCLELIFPYLDVSDLVNVADTCKQMKRAAEIIFAYKYGRTHFFINIKEYEQSDKRFEETSRTYHNWISLYDPKIYYRILRCFGHLISKLWLYNIGYITELLLTHSDEYVIKYCAKYLTELDISGRKLSFENFQKISFPNVEKVRLTNCHLDEFITNLNERFPKMRSLELASGLYMGTTVDDQSRIITIFPHLEHLTIGISSPEWKLEFQEETVMSVLKLNPNLRSLNLCSNSFMGVESLRSISEICKSLEILQITGGPLKLNGKIHFNSVKTFKIDHFIYSFKSPDIPLTFDALENFEWSSSLSMRPIVYDFVRNNPTITKLCLWLRASSNDIFPHDERIEMISSFAFLKELEIVYPFVDMEEKITVFLDNCKSLQRLILKALDENVFYQLIKLTKSLQNVAVTVDKREKSIICQKSIKN